MDGVDEMDRYVKEVEVTINQKLAALTTKPTWGFLVMAVREDGKIKAWVDTDDGCDIPPSESSTQIVRLPD